MITIALTGTFNILPHRDHGYGAQLLAGVRSQIAARKGRRGLLVRVEVVRPASRAATPAQNYRGHADVTTTVTRRLAMLPRLQRHRCNRPHTVRCPGFDYIYGADGVAATRNQVIGFVERHETLGMPGSAEDLPSAINTDGSISRRMQDVQGSAWSTEVTRQCVGCDVVEEPTTGPKGAAREYNRSFTGRSNPRNAIGTEPRNVPGSNGEARAAIVRALGVSEVETRIAVLKCP